jgi:hypothetical protein
VYEARHYGYFAGQQCALSLLAAPRSSRRGDCVFVVSCPECGRKFTLDEDEYEELLAWSRSTDLSCGIAL